MHGLKALKDRKYGPPLDTKCLNDLAYFISDRDKPRRLFVSFSGHIGLAPTIAKDGDLVCDLRGFRLPFILRRDQDLATRINVKTYTLIGEAFVPSLINKEGLRIGEEEDIILR